MSELPRDCQECKDYKKCSYINGKDWYHYGEIRFCPFQMMFLIDSSLILLEGNWPDSPDGSNYIDGGIRSGFRNEAYFTKPEEIIGEVEYRMRTTGVCGEALIDEIGQGLGFEQLSRPARRALMYIKGFHRKRITFSRWMAKERYKSVPFLPPKI